MAIERLVINGFRSLKHVEWKPGALNVLIGPNGSGKSNLLRALMFLRHAAVGDFDKLVLEAGGMGALVWDSRSDTIGWGVVVQTASHHQYRYHLEIRRIGSSAEYVIGSEALASNKGMLFERRDRKVFVEREQRHFGKTFNLSQNTVLSALQHEPTAEDFLEVLRSISVYHDMDVRQNSELRRAAIARLDRKLAPDGQNLISVLHTLYTTDREFKRVLTESMRAAFGPEFEELTFPPAADQRVDLRIRWRSLKTEQSAADLSDGTLRFLLLITMLASAAPGEIIAIDEPEVGLHPNMLPLVAELAREASQQSQIILTTHSPQFLDAFEEPPTTTVTMVENGESKFATLEGAALAVWLEKYTLGELFRSGELEALA